MSRRSWTHLKANAAAKLTAICPWLKGHALVLTALSTVTALADVDFTIRPIAGRLDPDLRTSPSVAGDALAQELVDLISQAASAHASSAQAQLAPAFGDWLEGHGFSDMSIALLSSDADWETLRALARNVARAVKDLAERSLELGQEHLQDVLARDLPQALFLSRGLSQVAAWLLAPEMSGQPHRPEHLKRRYQAMTLYGAVSSTLRQADITKVIDAGLPLAPALIDRLGLNAGQLRALRGARSLRHTIESHTDFRIPVEELKVHEVPLHEWPGDGRPEEPRAWQTSSWTNNARQHLVRPDYLEPHKDAVTDAINALRQDLLRPLIAERIRLGGYSPSSGIMDFSRTVELGRSEPTGPARRRLIGALRAAIVGRRQPKAFHAAVGLWHRRVASLSALRHERTVARPGWPALCAPWRSACGQFDIVVLASAADLVEEGRMLDHCVGGYYDICRRGDTQILSLRQHGKRVATVELKLPPDPQAIILEVGQFKARRNTAPSPHLHDPLRAFLKDVRSGNHRVNALALARYRKAMRDVWDGAWSSAPLSIDHAREVFPFYLPLLPRGTAADFEAWSQATGLIAAIDATLTHLKS